MGLGRRKKRNRPSSGASTHASKGTDTHAQADPVLHRHLTGSAGHSGQDAHESDLYVAPPAFSRLQLAAALIEYDEEDDRQVDDLIAPRPRANLSALFLPFTDDDPLAHVDFTAGRTFVRKSQQHPVETLSPAISEDALSFSPASSSPESRWHQSTPAKRATAFATSSASLESRDEDESMSQWGLDKVLNRHGCSSVSERTPSKMTDTASPLEISFDRGSSSPGNEEGDTTLRQSQFRSRHDGLLPLPGEDHSEHGSDNSHQSFLPALSLSPAKSSHAMLSPFLPAPSDADPCPSAQSVDISDGSYISRFDPKATERLEQARSIRFPGAVRPRTIVLPELLQDDYDSDDLAQGFVGRAPRTAEEQAAEDLEDDLSVNPENGAPSASAVAPRPPGKLYGSSLMDELDKRKEDQRAKQRSFANTGGLVWTASGWVERAEEELHDVVAEDGKILVDSEPFNRYSRAFRSAKSDSSTHDHDKRMSMFSAYGNTAARNSKLLASAPDPVMTRELSKLDKLLELERVERIQQDKEAADEEARVAARLANRKTVFGLGKPKRQTIVINARPASICALPKCEAIPHARIDETVDDGDENSRIDELLETPTPELNIDLGCNLAMNDSSAILDLSGTIIDQSFRISSKNSESWFDGRSDSDSDDERYEAVKPNEQDDCVETLQDLPPSDSKIRSVTMHSVASRACQSPRDDEEDEPISKLIKRRSDLPQIRLPNFRMSSADLDQSWRRSGGAKARPLSIASSISGDAPIATILARRNESMNKLARAAPVSERDEDIPLARLRSSSTLAEEDEDVPLALRAAAQLSSDEVPLGIANPAAAREQQQIQQKQVALAAQLTFLQNMQANVMRQSMLISQSHRFSGAFAPSPLVPSAHDDIALESVSRWLRVRIYRTRGSAKSVKSREGGHLDAKLTFSQRV
ncbi:uncharacterized protein L969DRAFT_96890 [Mixia osmundae IAM 14324]|uniref:Uncharacterized protein n=1 Tax=Mixia osmundae (strain CBS 9802 / IAM 14324 / JCM 22182 / KY 12970) TaxID=764103 RepID=G7E2E1_MIXOS|nr:uncharacterized protein L969DRAFT_96890 [Mixia osmundae IAM 14324]KEI36872.1 hypothetical protein L969DRAFT_96890 [Mixia osmundae IAM 14324]GAA97001.1 hypothetical protein E5Q_03675 [Mixia osmundae IAM 14324]